MFWGPLYTTVDEDWKTAQTTFVFSSYISLLYGPWYVFCWRFIFLRFHIYPARRPVSLYRRSQSISLYGHSWFNFQRKRTARPPFSHLGMLFYLFIYGLTP